MSVVKIVCSIVIHQLSNLNNSMADDIEASQCAKITERASGLQVHSNHLAKWPKAANQSSVLYLWPDGGMCWRGDGPSS